jgi:C_GCAxxG_C_C family probable redox protein
MDRITFASNSMINQTTNCAQSVINVFVEELGIEQETALKLALGFGGGMGHTGGTCGAVSAAYMVLGLKQPFDPASPKKYRDHLYALEQEFTLRFKKEHGSISCSQLLGCDLSTPEGVAAAKERGLTASLCPKLVATAVKLLEEMA